MSSLSGKIAIVTGASDGIGRAIAERLARDGAVVVVNYGKSVEKAKAVVAGIETGGARPWRSKLTWARFPMLVGTDPGVRD